MILDLPHVSTWLGIVVYSAGVSFFIVVVGIAVANWQMRRNIRSIFSAAAATCATLYVLALAGIASDWLPWLSGVYVALALRSLFGLAIFFAYVALIIYLRQRKDGAPC